MYPFLKNQGRHKKIRWFHKTFWGEEDELEKGQKKFYQLLRTRFCKIQDLPKGFEKTVFSSRGHAYDLNLFGSVISIMSRNSIR